MHKQEDKGYAECHSMAHEYVFNIIEKNRIEM